MGRLRPPSSRGHAPCLSDPIPRVPTYWFPSNRSKCSALGPSHALGSISDNFARKCSEIGRVYIGRLAYLTIRLVAEVTHFNMRCGGACEGAHPNKHGLFFDPDLSTVSVASREGSKNYSIRASTASEESEHVFPSGSSPDDRNPY